MKKFTAALLMMLSFITAGAGELTIYGDFPEPVKPGGQPKNWNLTSGARGSLEFVSTEDGNAVMLSADEKKSFGIYSRPAAVKAGDKIKVSAQIRGEKVALGIFQYSDPRGTASQRKTVTAADGVAEAEFTVANTRKGATNAIRVCVYAEKGQGVSVLNIKAVRE